MTLLRDGKPHWSIEAHLLDDLRMVETGTKKNPAKPHPQRPTGKPRKAHDPAAIARHRKRAAERARKHREVSAWATDRTSATGSSP